MYLFTMNLKFDMWLSKFSRKWYEYKFHNVLRQSVKRKFSVLDLLCDFRVNSKLNIAELPMLMFRASNIQYTGAK